MAGNKNLNSAAKAKKDEFYTQIADIENELWHYQKFFEGKTVLCNCDDPYESDFFKYFMIYFNQLGLRKVIATCYAGSPIVQTELDFFGTQNYNPHFDKRTQAIKLEVTEVTDLNGDGAADLADVKLLLENNRNVVTYLEGNGDFRSPECVEALKEADVVVTNPPFSLFREYVAQLVDYDKKFLIIGNMNAITYKEIFPLIKENKLWLGYGFNGGNAYLQLPNGQYKEFAEGVFNAETGLVKFRNLHWFTNLDVRKRHEDILLFKRYAEEPELFPHYDNYDAIEVPKTAFIPVDYFDVMGVPITFLDKYCPNQFEIVGNAGSYGVDGYSLCPALYIGGKKIYKRILIRRRRQ
ncbi:MAG: adenine-specific methyltransferase EcoRI family protein [Selenomonadaceae bacterium]|nr:adenine-specific methyltransferase EcoRI family protein [Selenomonadaceae bacterium]